MGMREGVCVCGGGEQEGQVCENASKKSTFYCFDLPFLVFLYHTLHYRDYYLIIRPQLCLN